MRGCRVITLVAFVLGPLPAGRAQALPPPGAAVGSANIDVARWIEHRVIAGERLAEIAERYRVEVAKIVEWNELDPGDPRLLAGQALRIFTTEAVAERKRRTLVVRDDDTWQRIANRFGVPLNRLRNQWNPGVTELVPGERIVVFVEVQRPQRERVEIDAPPPPETTPAQKRANGTAATTRGPIAAVVDVPAPANARSGKPSTAATAPPTSAEAKPPASAKAAAATASARPAATAPAKPVTAALPIAKPLPAKPIATPSPSAQANAKALAPKPRTSGRPVASARPSQINGSFASLMRPTTMRAKAPAPRRPRKPPVPRLPIKEVERGALSAGSCTRGRLIDGVQLPENPALYSIRNPDNSWGSTHAVEQLQRAIARFREDSGFDRELLVCDMSKQRGGRFRPHHSHTSGRDVDVQLPTKRGVPSSIIPREVGQVDWDATWALVSALVSTGEVKYIFLSRSRQRPLYEAALRAGERPESLRDFIQYPDGSRTALLRHSQGHVKHLHVRFKCGAHEPRCED